MEDKNYTRSDFGKNFSWGVSTASYQTEGAWNVDGKGESIWDRFTHTKGKIKTGETGDVACDFYNRYESDIQIMSDLNIENFRFSLSWSRIFPEGTGKVNQAGVDYYNRVIDTCIKKGIKPWITLYHWDLPQKLQDRGGWMSRDVVEWFEEYVEFVTKAFGDRVKNWMVLNEPVAFTTLGYFLGIHAPGKRNPKAFLRAVHHAALCQALGGKIVRKNIKNVKVGTTISCAYIEPFNQEKKHVLAAKRIEAMLNKLFLEPALGMGYPWDDFNYLKRLQKHMLPGDEEKLAFDFDYWGVQYYTREVIKYNMLVPFVQAKMVDPRDKGAALITEMNWEVFPQGLYRQLMEFSKYEGIKEMIVTENGSAFPDTLTAEGRVHDENRTEYLRDHIEQVLKARQDGAPMEGYFIWTFTDNFEWAEGNNARFGLVYNDFETQNRYPKDSGLWVRDFLAGKPAR